MDEKNKNSQPSKNVMAQEIRERSVGYIVAAFGLVVGLAWNEAIKSLIEYIFPLAKNTLLAKFVYAAVLTAILVVVTSYFTRVFRRRD